MPFGIRVINDNGIIQIDDQQPNFTLLSQGSVYINPRSGNNAGMASVGFPGQSTPAMIFIRPPFGYRVAGSNTPHTFESFKSSFQLFNFETSGATVEYAIFGNRAEQGDSGGYGLQIRNSGGQVVFSTNDVAPRIVGAVEYSVASTGSTFYINASGGPGRLFFSLSGTGWRATSNAGPTAPWLAEVWCGRLLSESQVEYSIGAATTSPGAKSAFGVRMALAARVY